MAILDWTDDDKYNAINQASRVLSQTGIESDPDIRKFTLTINTGMYNDNEKEYMIVISIPDGLKKSDNKLVPLSMDIFDVDLYVGNSLVDGFSYTNEYIMNLPKLVNKFMNNFIPKIEKGNMNSSKCKRTKISKILNKIKTSDTEDDMLELISKLRDSLIDTEDLVKGSYKKFGEVRGALEDLNSIITGVLSENSPLIKVKFYIDDKAEEVIAVFVDEVFDNNQVEVYSHDGQHSTADMGYISELRKATPAEYKDLYNELKNDVGYNMIVIK